MAKTLKDFLEGYLKVKSADEQKFIDKHVTAKNPDRNGNGDDVFNGSTKPIDRRKERKGYNPGEDEKVYESVSAYDKDNKIVGRYKDMETAKKLKPGHRYVKEELKGNQHKIDANKNGKVDAHDFKLLRAKKKVAEEAEQIDELSTDTLKSYRTKARAQGNKIVDKMKMGGGDWSKDQKDTQTLRKRSKGANMSGKQLVKRGESLKTEEVEQIDEISAETKDSYAKKAVKQLPGLFNKSGKDADAARKYYNRKNTVRKIANEEVDQIDEISQGLAMKAFAKRNAQAAKKFDNDEDTGRASTEYKKREKTGEMITKKYGAKGYSKAVGAARKELGYNEEVELDEKLTAKTPMGTYIKDFQKSDAPQFKGKSQAKRRAMAIAAKLTAERGGKPLNKEERLQDRLADISESHQRVMLDVFDKLNEENKTKFMEACTTPEGVDQMLDFAIRHRGE